MSRWWWPALPALAAMGLALGGCAADKQAGTENDTAAEVTENVAQDTKEEAKEAAGKASNALENAALTTRVKTALSTLKDVDATEINVDSNNGEVTLTGTVQDAKAKKDALETAKKTEGVQSVVDKLKVGTPGPNEGPPEDGPARNPNNPGN